MVYNCASAYNNDGSGRDSYVSYNSGGLNRESPRAPDHSIFRKADAKSFKPKGLGSKQFPRDTHAPVLCYPAETGGGPRSLQFHDYTSKTFEKFLRAELTPRENTVRSLMCTAETSDQVSAPPARTQSATSPRSPRASAAAANAAAASAKQTGSVLRLASPRSTQTASSRLADASFGLDSPRAVTADRVLTSRVGEFHPSRTLDGAARASSPTPRPWNAVGPVQSSLLSPRSPRAPLRPSAAR